MSSEPGKFVARQFIGEEITVYFENPPMLSKKPGPPDRFHWQENEFIIAATLSTWFDFGRKGRMAINMREEHLRQAERRGSWGVGRFYFRVRTQEGRIFDLYYDRAPKDAGDRQGHWFLWREMEEKGNV